MEMTNKLNIIFLDIDGVLNSIESMEEAYLEWRDLAPELRKDKDTDWPPKILIARLVKLLYETNSVIVLSSCWRYVGVEKMKENFKRMGIPLELYISNTARFRGKKRGIEIQHWLDNEWDDEKFNNFVILDDDSDMEHLMYKLVQTDVEVGLQDSDCEKVKEILGK